MSHNREFLHEHFVRGSESSLLPEHTPIQPELSKSSFTGSEVRDFYLSLFEDDVKPLAQKHSPSSSCSLACESNSRAHISSVNHQFAVLSQKPRRPASLFIPPSNPGYEILRRLGWIDIADDNVPTTAVGETGGLGRHGQGRRFPIATILKRDRKGIGADKKNCPRITHFVRNDPAAVKNCPKRPNAKLDKQTQARRAREDKRKEIRFRQEFYLDDEQLKLLYGETGFSF
uniref:G-patch domain-containing protein n=1 Tax=Mesocestoides corti TaxID=53468 RepID=A0A5K3EUZ2_MESCO